MPMRTPVLGKRCLIFCSSVMVLQQLRLFLCSRCGKVLLFWAALMLFGIVYSVNFWSKQHAELNKILRHERTEGKATQQYLSDDKRYNDGLRSSDQGRINNRGASGHGHFSRNDRVNNRGAPDDSKRGQRHIPDNVQSTSKVTRKVKPTDKLTTKNIAVLKVTRSKSRPNTNTNSILESIPKIKVPVSCSKLFTKDKKEIIKAKRHEKLNPKVPIPDKAYADWAANCQQFRKVRQYIMEPLTTEEESFPIAYSILVYKDTEQVERLLRAIYRPQNHYCIHVDKKSSADVHNSMRAIAKCFANVFIASKSIDVQWGTYSVLEPDLVCMGDLWKYKKWRYFINLTGQEFPLKTNLDLVKILKVYNGANSMEGTKKRRNVERLSFAHDGAIRTDKRKKAAPHSIEPTKGSVHIAASRAFIDYVLHHKVALDFRQWVKDTGVPDETFFSSLNHNPQLKVPGAYTGEPETDPTSYPFMTRFKNWGVYPFQYPCRGQRVRMICIFSVEDLPLLKSRKEMFANKFYLDYNSLALDCMEELHFNRTRDEILGKRKFDTSYYETLPYVKHHV